MRRDVVFALFFLCFVPSFVLAQDRVFQNQLHDFGGDGHTVARHAKQMAYDYIAGQPWSKEKAQIGSANGVGVLFNSTAGDEAKWLRFNNPGGVGSSVPPNKVNAFPISETLYPEMEKSLCMKSVTAAPTDLKKKYFIATQYETSAVVMFKNNYRCSSGIDLMVKQNVELYNLHGGNAVHDGLFLDQVNEQVLDHYPVTCLNPCITDPNETVYNMYDGQLEYIRRIRDYFKNVLGKKTSGNPWNVKKWITRHNQVPLDLVYNESTKDFDPALWDVKLHPVSATHLGIDNTSYPLVLDYMGLAAVQKVWFGNYGGVFPGASTNSTQLAKAIPNWDNLVNASGRSWDKVNKIYRSTNSYADPTIIYGRHPKSKKIFVVFQNTQAVLPLKSSDVIKDIKRVDKIFIETETGSADIQVTGANLTLANAAMIGKGYIIEVGSESKPDEIPVVPTMKNVGAK